MPAPSDGAKASRLPNVHDLLASLDNKSIETRVLARETLIGLGRPAVEPLVRLLGDRHEHLRWEAAKALSAIAHPSSAPALVRVMETEHNADIRWLAAMGIIAMGQGGLEPLLLALAEHPGAVRLRECAHHVLHDLAQKKETAFLQPVLDAMNTPEPDLVIPVAAYAALRRLRNGA